VRRRIRRGSPGARQIRADTCFKMIRKPKKIVEHVKWNSFFTHEGGGFILRVAMGWKKTSQVSVENTLTPNPLVCQGLEVGLPLWWPTQHHLAFIIRYLMLKQVMSSQITSTPTGNYFSLLCILEVYFWPINKNQTNRLFTFSFLYNWALTALTCGHWLFSWCSNSLSGDTRKGCS
jgi:hypothetical protein